MGAASSDVSQVETSTTATITATLGWSSQADTLLIQPNVALASLSFAADELAPGASTTGPLRSMDRLRLAERSSR